MPAHTYKNRLELDPQTPLRRYMSLDDLLRVLRFNQLRLTRTDQFDDTFEGSITKKQSDDQVPIFSSNNEFFIVSGDEPCSETNLDPWTKMKRRRLAMKRSVHASCWSLGPESGAMWKLYCKDQEVKGQGVAIECTLESLEESVTHLDLYGSPIRYLHYHEDIAFNDELDSFFHKRQAFAHEAEFRLLRYNKEHYNQHAVSIHECSPEPERLDKYIYLPWPEARSMGRILVSPYATSEYKAQVDAAIHEIDPRIVEHVQPSVLSERNLPFF